MYSKVTKVVSRSNKETMLAFIVEDSNGKKKRYKLHGEDADKNYLKYREVLSELLKGTEHEGREPTEIEIQKYLITKEKLDEKKQAFFKSKSGVITIASVGAVVTICLAGYNFFGKKKFVPNTNNNTSISANLPTKEQLERDFGGEIHADDQTIYAAEPTAIPTPAPTMEPEVVEDFTPEVSEPKNIQNLRDLLVFEGYSDDVINKCVDWVYENNTSVDISAISLEVLDYSVKKMVINPVIETPIPTLEPTQVPTPVPTQVPTPVPTQVPTPVPAQVEDNYYVQSREFIFKKPGTAVMMGYSGQNNFTPYESTEYSTEDLLKKINNKECDSMSVNYDSMSAISNYFDKPDEKLPSEAFFINYGYLEEDGYYGNEFVTYFSEYQNDIIKSTFDVAYLDDPKAVYKEVKPLIQGACRDILALVVDGHPLTVLREGVSESYQIYFSDLSKEEQAATIEVCSKIAITLNGKVTYNGTEYTGTFTLEGEADKVDYEAINSILGDLNNNLEWSK